VFCRKANLKLTVERLKLQKKKRANLADNEKRSVADMLAKGQEDEARIHTEQIIKEDNVCEAYEVLELFCELLLSRISVMKLSTAPPAELAEAIQTLCFAGTQHQNLKELLVVRSLMVEKYGKPYVARAVANADGVVNAAVVKKLSVSTPAPAAVTKYMAAIAAKYDVDWQPELEPDANGVFPVSGHVLFACA
jgi:vacuolar protein sorting-associated protein IST1